jgi:23S rRNA pseudouridine955/2504/2580 synthase
MKNKFLIPKDHSGIRLHKWLRKQFPSLPLSAVHRSLRTKKVRLNEKRAKGEEVLYEGDIVQLFFDPGGEMLQKSSTPPSPPVPDALLKKNFPVLYEDEEIVAINKPPGIPVHPGSKTSAGRSIIELANAKYSENIRLAHRLDKNTSGVLLLAKNGGSLRTLLKDLKAGLFQKQYRALVFGHVPQESGVIDLPLQRQEKGIKMIAGRGKQSVTHYTVQQKFHDCSLVSVELETGRTHQIRAHFAAIGHPIVGDDQHGDFSKNKMFQKKFGLKRQFLHAHTLVFPHPNTREQITLVAPLPGDLQSVLDKFS